MWWIFGVVVFIVILAVTIGIHEWGHMAVARKFGLNVPRYFIGFGSTVWSFKRGGTEYGVKAIPAGGFVEIFDPNIEDENNPDRGLLTNVHPAKRVAVFAAGPLVNIVVGVVVIVIALMMMPYAVPTTVVRDVDSCEVSDVCGAFNAGLEPGDKILEINGTPTKDISDILQNIPDEDEVMVLLSRNGEELLLPVQVSDSRLGINVHLEEGRRSVGEAFGTMGDIVSDSAMALAELPSKIPGVFNSIIGKEERAIDSPGSIVSAANLYGQVTSSEKFNISEKATQLLFYTGAINLSIGLINLFLPMLPLDGGRIVIALSDWSRMGWSKITRRDYTPTSYKLVEALTYTMGILIISIMGLLIIADFVAPINV